jgi:glutamyl-tRNA synthetase
LRKERPNPRKDYAKYSDIEPLTRFFYADDYAKIVSSPLPFNPSYDHALLAELLSVLSEKMLYGVDEATWWNGVKEVGVSLGFAANNKDYKANPSAYKGSVSDCAEILRIALTGSKQSPNLHEVIEILGQPVVSQRLKALSAHLS